MGGKKEESGGVAGGRCVEGADDRGEKKTAWVSGHVLRGTGLERDCLLGMIEGKRARGRQRMQYIDGIKEMVEKETMEEVGKSARNRRVWRSIVANVN